MSKHCLSSCTYCNIILINSLLFVLPTEQLYTEIIKQ